MYVEAHVTGVESNNAVGWVAQFFRRWVTAWVLASFQELSHDPTALTSVPKREYGDGKWCVVRHYYNLALVALLRWRP